MPNNSTLRSFNAISQLMTPNLSDRGLEKSLMTNPSLTPQMICAWSQISSYTALLKDNGTGLVTSAIQPPAQGCTPHNFNLHQDSTCGLKLFLTISPALDESTRFPLQVTRQSAV